MGIPWRNPTHAYELEAAKIALTSYEWSQVIKGNKYITSREWKLHLSLSLPLSLSLSLNTVLIKISPNHKTTP